MQSRDDSQAVFEWLAVLHFDESDTNDVNQKNHINDVLMNIFARQVPCEEIINTVDQMMNAVINVDMLSDNLDHAHAVLGFIVNHVKKNPHLMARTDLNAIVKAIEDKGGQIKEKKSFITQIKGQKHKAAELSLLSQHIYGYVIRPQSSAPNVLQQSLELPPILLRNIESIIAFLAQRKENTKILINHPEILKIVFPKTDSLPKKRDEHKESLKKIFFLQLLSTSCEEMNLSNQLDVAINVLDHLAYWLSAAKDKEVAFIAEWLALYSRKVMNLIMLDWQEQKSKSTQSVHLALSPAAKEVLIKIKDLKIKKYSDSFPRTASSEEYVSRSKKKYYYDEHKPYDGVPISHTENIRALAISLLNESGYEDLNDKSRDCFLPEREWFRLRRSVDTDLISEIKENNIGFYLKTKKVILNEKHPWFSEIVGNESGVHYRFRRNKAEQLHYSANEQDYYQARYPHNIEYEKILYQDQQTLIKKSLSALIFQQGNFKKKKYVYDVEFQYLTFLVLMFIAEKKTAEVKHVMAILKNALYIPQSDDGSTKKNKTYSFLYRLEHKVDRFLLEQTISNPTIEAKRAYWDNVVADQSKSENYRYWLELAKLADQTSPIPVIEYYFRAFDSYYGVLGGNKKADQFSLRVENDKQNVYIISLLWSYMQKNLGYSKMNKLLDKIVQDNPSNQAVKAICESAKTMEEGKIYPYQNQKNKPTLEKYPGKMLVENPEWFLPALMHYALHLDTDIHNMDKRIQDSTSFLFDTQSPYSAGYAKRRILLEIACYTLPEHYPEDLKKKLLAIQNQARDLLQEMSQDLQDSFNSTFPAYVGICNMLANPDKHLIHDLSPFEKMARYDVWKKMVENPQTPLTPAILQARRILKEREEFLNRFPPPSAPRDEQQTWPLLLKSPPPCNPEVVPVPFSSIPTVSPFEPEQNENEQTNQNDLPVAQDSLYPNMSGNDTPVEEDAASVEEDDVPAQETSRKDEESHADVSPSISKITFFAPKEGDKKSKMIVLSDGLKNKYQSELNTLTRQLEKLEEDKAKYKVTKNILEDKIEKINEQLVKKEKSIGELENKQNKNEKDNMKLKSLSIERRDLNEPLIYLQIELQDCMHALSKTKVELITVHSELDVLQKILAQNSIQKLQH